MRWQTRRQDYAKLTAASEVRMATTLRGRPAPNAAPVPAWVAAASAALIIAICAGVLLLQPIGDALGWGTP